MAEEVKWYKRRKDQVWPQATADFYAHRFGNDYSRFTSEDSFQGTLRAGAGVVDDLGASHFPGYLEEVPAPETVATAVPITDIPGTLRYDARFLGDTVDLPDANPKTRFGVAKPPLNLIPGPARAHIAMALQDGQRKYGRANWRVDPVTASTYLNACERHLTAWTEGEERAKDSGVHHLAHAAACLIILLDAQECKSLQDDRPTPSNFPEIIERLTAPMVST